MYEAYGLTSKNEVANQKGRRDFTRNMNSFWISKRSPEWGAAEAFCYGHFVQQNGSKYNQPIGL